MGGERSELGSARPGSRTYLGGSPGLSTLLAPAELAALLETQPAWVVVETPRGSRFSLVLLPGWLTPTGLPGCLETSLYVAIDGRGAYGAHLSDRLDPGYVSQKWGLTRSRPDSLDLTAWLNGLLAELARRRRGV
jgi:hypothetical protein